MTDIPVQNIVEDGPIWNAIDRGGGQTCDIPGVVRALNAAGFVIVPRDSTEAMLNALKDYDLDSITPKQEWQVMVDAALQITES